MLRASASSAGFSRFSSRPVLRQLRWRLAWTSVAAACVLAGCQRVTPPPSPRAAAAAPASEPASASAAVPLAYTAPSADALYQMVAPIALYPDKLVAQVLAGATYPDQISSAETWLGQNPGLKGDALASAADAQPWDPSVKSLTSFPNVLEQLAANLPWTTALGKAYYHDPSDVMNAIQAMRTRAAQVGALKSSPHLRVTTVAAGAAVPPPPPVQQPVAMYQGPAVVPPPATVITIEPAQAQAIYVPSYDPSVVYGTPVPVYPSYRWAVPVAPTPVAVAAGPDPVAVGAMAFGAGVLVGAVASHHHAWGWDAWNLHWGAPPPAAVAWSAAPPPPAGRPAVVYRGATYVSNSTTVIENVHNRATVNNRNIYVNAPGHSPGAPAPTVPAAALAAGPAPLQQAALAPPRPGSMTGGRPVVPAPQALQSPPVGAALQGSHGNVPHGLPNDHGNRFLPAAESGRIVGHQPGGAMQTPGRAQVPGAPSQPIAHAALGRPGEQGLGLRFTDRPPPEALQGGRSAQAEGAVKPLPMEARNRSVDLHTAAPPVAMPEHGPARPGMEPSVHRPAVVLGTEPPVARMQVPVQRAPMPAEAPGARAPQQQPTHSSQQPAHVHPPVPAEPRGSVAPHAAVQPVMPRPAPHEARPQPRLASPPPPSHAQPQHAQEREHRPHGEHGG